ncbi:bifunctional protein GlmU [Insulibacter thermoxylanivorax]|uniref:Bifunctional protein GlmU n=1 Tax=Insulibacter thermoxylanivorax TaxID=2749268 RepID=A0A916VFK8_9BACL|nr:bifunctional UDP-N-acetylglucosamine diphosphorylase/glucosamine-1-phosphate N-acetyltransferase GlmU [Insulibacter thermoxylanivorax]GFR38407.1 bifunctional protein GlmU [Insulibacter thermoxylanivorax]
MNRYGIVLAAGQGKRMKSKLYKVLHEVCGKPMVGHVTDALAEAGIQQTYVVVGHGAEAVQQYLGERVQYVMQQEQLGTGHAVLQAAPLLAEQAGTTVIVCGDTPLIRGETIRRMVELHEESGAAATIMTAVIEDPTGYGRIIRGADGSVARIVEHKDCDEEEAAVREINAGTYVFDNRKLFAALSQVTNDNAQGEYYLTDVFRILSGEQERIIAYPIEDITETIGVNDRIALAEAERHMRERINRELMQGGVTIIDPVHTYIESGVTIGADTVLLPGTILRSGTIIGEDCVIGPQAEIAASKIGSGVTIRYAVLEQAVVGDGTTVGPFAYLRPGAEIGSGVKIGDFVEIKNSVIGNGSKVPHLSYVGDAYVGERVNIGCGVITANYDGFNKNRTTIKNDAFIGSNSNLIAPVTVGEGAYVVAGSTITQDVPDDAMAVARERQTNKEGYASRIKARMKSKKRES